MTSQDEINDRIYSDAADQTIELGNQIMEKEPQADLFDVSDGLLAGAIQYWLFARIPCDNPNCKDCEPIDTAEKRLSELLRFTEELARGSDYFHSPNDANAGRA